MASPTRPADSVLASARDGTTLEAIGKLGKAQLRGVPGERWEYANGNYAGGST